MQDLEDIFSIFGSLKLDLRGSKLDSDTLIKASSLFGSIDILLDDDVNVILKTTPIFGSIVNKVRSKSDSNKTIYIEGFALYNRKLTLRFYNFDTLQIAGQRPDICYLLINLLFFFIDVMKTFL